MKFVYPNIFQSRDDDCVPEFHSVVSYGFICQDSFQWQLWVNSIFNISFNKSFLNITRTISSLSYAIIPILILNFFSNTNLWLFFVHQLWVLFDSKLTIKKFHFWYNCFLFHEQKFQFIYNTNLWLISMY